MADKRISQLVERVDIANNDVLPIVASGATTTNKVTISTIQDWMQENLDVGVTSVGITIGSSGTDVSVSGSPITTSGNITINIPTASATNRGLLSAADWTTFNNKQDAGSFVTLDTAQTITGNKTFNSGTLQVPSGGLGGLPLRFANAPVFSIALSGYNTIGFNGSNNLFITRETDTNGVVLAFDNTAVRTYTLQDASGTLAFTSDLDGYVTLDTAQIITAQKTFTTSGSTDSVIISHGSGSGIALDVIKAGSGQAIRVQKTSGSGDAVTITGGLLNAETGSFSGNIAANGGLTLAAAGSANPTILRNTSGTTSSTTGSNVIGFNGVNNIFVSTQNRGGFILGFNNSVSNREYTLPDASGTVALTSDLGNYVTIGTTQTITGAKTFETTTSTFALMNSTNANGGVLSFRRNGINVGHIGNSAQLGAGVLDAIEVRSGVGSSVILKSDGGQITLGDSGAVTLTGALNGTSASFSGGVTASQSVFTHASTPIRLNNLGGQYTQLDFLNNGTQKGAIWWDNSANSLNLWTGTTALSLSSTGAATFSSSVTANRYLINGSNGNSGQIIQQGDLLGTVATNLLLQSSSGNSIGFLTNGSNDFRMLINTAGNVGIGTSSPDVYGFGSSGKYLTLQNTGGFSLIQVISNGTDGSGISFGNATIRRASIDAVNGSDLTFNTNASNSSSTLTERMRITSGGVIQNNGGVYDTGSSTTHWIARVQGNDRIISDTNGYVYMPFLTTGSGIDDLGWWGSSSGAWGYNGMLMRISSSARYKKNIRDIEIDTSKIYDLRPISYENNENTAVDGLTSFGLLAEEVAETIPELATYNSENEPEGVQYKMLAVLMLAELKKLKAEIEALKSQING